MASKGKIGAILPWYGGKRTLAPKIIQELGKHSYYLELCAGSVAVLLSKPKSSHEMVCDLHGGLINLAQVLSVEVLAKDLWASMRNVLYCDVLYQQSQSWLATHELPKKLSLVCPEHAYHYFLVSWMGRNGEAGLRKTGKQVATRYTQSGGSGPLRFHNAVEAIPDWHERLRNVHIRQQCMFETLEKIEDSQGIAIYADPPYLPETVSVTNAYKHDFSQADHERLAELLCGFKKARIVLSYYDCPRLRALYPGWRVVDCSRHKHMAVTGARGSGKEEAKEVLLVNGQ